MMPDPSFFPRPFLSWGYYCSWASTFARCQASSAPHRPLFALFSALSSTFFLYSLLSSEYSMAFPAHTSTICPEWHMIRSVTVIPSDLVPISLLGRVSYSSVKTPWWIATWGKRGLFHLTVCTQSSRDVIEETWSQEVDTVALEEYRLLVCFPWFVQLAFLSN